MKSMMDSLLYNYSFIYASRLARNMIIPQTKQLKIGEGTLIFIGCPL